MIRTPVPALVSFLLVGLFGIGAILNGLWTLGIGLIALSLVGSTAIYRNTRKLHKVLEKIEKTAAEFSAGNLDSRAPLRVGPISVALNDMAYSLSNRIHSLKTERAKMEALLSSLREGVIETDPNGDILHCNESARTFFQIRIDPLGLPLWQVIRHRKVETIVRSTIEKGETCSDDIELGGRYLSLYTSPVGRESGAVLVAHDRTETHRYDEMRKEFVANASHELQTPLTILKANLETLNAGAWEEKEKRTRFLEGIDRNINRLSALVTDLLDLSKIESTREISDPQNVSLPEFYGQIRDAFLPLAEKKGIVLESSSEVETVSADPNLLERALSNLVDNALKYTGEGGAVTLSATEVDSRIRLSVKDSGAGIPEEHQTRIFERFYRVDKSRSRDLGGTGLGLAIVKHVAGLHGGEVLVQSSAEEGTTFTIDLPK